MSILIKGMEMPKKCCECLLAKLSPTGESLLCNYMLSTVPWDETPSDCPLVPVPVHGRLGDLDALIDKVIAKYLEHERNGELLFAAAEIKQDICDLISDAPTIIPASEEVET
jgi:hypothetical protein